MKKKKTYFAPETEQMVISFEEHFLDGSVTVGVSDVANWTGSDEEW